MSDLWMMEEAEGRFSEVVERALTSAPQIVLRGDLKAVIVISEAQHDRLTEALQRLIRMGGTPPDPVFPSEERSKGKGGLWSFIESLPPVKELREAGLPPDALGRVLREERERSRRACQGEAEAHDSAAD